MLSYSLIHRMHIPKNAITNGIRELKNDVNSNIIVFLKPLN